MYVFHEELEEPQINYVCMYSMSCPMGKLIWMHCYPTKFYVMCDSQQKFGPGYVMPTQI